MEKKAAKTAWGPMFQVALEQLIPEEQRIFHDAVAYRLIPTPLKGLVNLFRIAFLRKTVYDLMERQVCGVRGGVLCRKRYIEDKLTAALGAGIQSAVILGAGYDTLAYRVPELASRQVFEVDLPEIIRSKEARLEALFGAVPAHAKLVATDFESQDLAAVLQQAGHLSVRPAFFVWEAVTQYISEPAVCRVFEFLKTAPAGSQLVFTYIRQDFIEGRHLYGLDLMYRQTVEKKRLWQFGLEPEVVGAFLSHYSWRELEQAGADEFQERYIEPLNRAMPVMKVERVVHAERLAD